MTTPPDHYDGPEPGVVYPSPVPDPPAAPVDYRARFVRWLLAQVGVSDPARYFERAAPCYPTAAARRGKSWCQIMLLAGLIECGLTDWRWKDVDGFVWRLGKDARVIVPDPGDIVIIPRSKAGKWVWHGCGALSLDGYMLTSVDGNTRGGLVKKCVRDVRIYDPRPYYFSIQALADKADALELADTEPPGAA